MPAARCVNAHPFEGVPNRHELGVVVADELPGPRRAIQDLCREHAEHGDGCGLIRGRPDLDVVLLLSGQVLLIVRQAETLSATKPWIENSIALTRR